MFRFVNQLLVISLPNGPPVFALPGDMVSIPVVIEPIFNDQVNENSATLHVRYGNDGPFAVRALQHKSGTNYEAMLPMSLCGLESEYWFSVETENGEMYRYPEDNDTLKVGVATELYSWNMDSNPGWTTMGQWEWGIPTGDGGEFGYPDPSSGATGLQVYGYNLQGDYENNLQQKHLTTNVLDVAGTQDIKLQFSRYLNVEQPVYDHASIAISADGGGNWTTLWSNPATIEDNAWQQVVYDISEVVPGAQTIQIRWTMGETDGAWRYSGWNIDDVQIMTTSSSGISGDANCDGVVDVTDVLEIVSYWGSCEGVCAQDIVPDGTINVSDLLHVIGNW